MNIKWRSVWWFVHISKSRSILPQFEHSVAICLPGWLSADRKYIRCFYWSMMMLTTIGDTAKPETNYVSRFLSAQRLFCIKSACLWWRFRVTVNAEIFLCVKISYSNIREVLQYVITCQNTYVICRQALLQVLVWQHVAALWLDVKPRNPGCGLAPSSKRRKVCTSHSRVPKSKRWEPRLTTKRPMWEQNRLRRGLSLRGLRTKTT